MKKKTTKKFSEVIEEVIALARAPGVLGRGTPQRHPDYPFVNEGEDSGPPPAEEVRLGELLSGLPAETIYKLVTVMDLGRDYFDTRDLAAGLAEAKRRYEGAKFAEGLMLDKAPLDGYLADGLAKLERDHIDMDALPMKPAAARRGRI